MEEDFISAIPVSDNPHLGYRGNINGWWGGTDNYGIYAEPIALFLATKGFNTKLLWNGITSLKEEIALGRPVEVWISGGLYYSQPFEIQASGQSFLLLPYEHTVTVYGYDENGVYVTDPGFGTYDYYTWPTFLRSWGYLGQMAMSVWPVNQPPVKGERPGIAPLFYREWLRNGGIELFGMPISQAYERGGKTIQYFERARLEYDNNQSSNQIIARGLLGSELTEQRKASGEPAFQPLNQTELSTLSLEELSYFFSETSFVIGQTFAAFWQTRGGLAAFGYPISRSFLDQNGREVQYFERVRMELHFEGLKNLPIIRLGLLGTEKLSATGS